MYDQIKQLADEALALQNKDSMDAALRKISVLCAQAAETQPAQPADKPAQPKGNRALSKQAAWPEGDTQ